VLRRPRASADYIIRKERKRTEELEEAGYRSPTWSVLQVLQQINSATKIEGEAATRMSAPAFSQSAGRGDLLCWGGKEGPTVVILEMMMIAFITIKSSLVPLIEGLCAQSLSEQEKKSWLEESSTMHDWVVWCK